jgi:hypothetical protein
VNGQVAYEAYAASTGGKTFDGREMPTWDELPVRIQVAWGAAAKAVAKQVYAAVQAAEDECPATQPAPPGYPS